MKITFDNQTRAQMQQAKENYNLHSGGTVSAAASEYLITPSLETGKDYEAGNKSFADVMSVSQAKSVSNETDRLIVLAHNMSEEDYAEYLKTGDLSKVDPKDAVTIVDHIKMSLVRGGTEVKGFTDDLSPELKKEIKQAIEKAEELTEMTEGMKRNLIVSGKDFTIDNLYLAKYSDGGAKTTGASFFAIEAPGYLAEKAAPMDEESLKAKVTELLTIDGRVPDEDTVEAGMWLVKNSLLVNEENITNYKKAENLILPINAEQLEKAIRISLSEGKNPKDADLTKTESIYEEAVRISDEILSLSDAEVHATRVLEEVRLKMTTEANLQLIRSGFSIDTSDLEAYVEALREVEKTPEYQESKAITEVSEAIKDIKSLPAAVIGRMMTTIPDADLLAIREEGNKIKESFESALVKYEQVATEVRKDLGDSIKKAFQNVDDILDEIGIEKTDINRRAVRILGYNSISINRENIEEIRSLDLKLNRVLNSITPADTLSLIRRGTSPLEMRLEELNEYIENRDSDEGTKMDNYAKFLYRLEKNDQISQEERSQYIDVYRLLHQLEKTDYAAIGGLLLTGKELSFANLKEQIKTSKHVGMDIKIDESFGFIVNELEKELMPERMRVSNITENTTLWQAYDSLSEEMAHDNTEDLYAKEMYRTFREGIESSEGSILELVSNGESVTIENLAIMDRMLRRKNNAFRKVDDLRRDDFREEMSELSEDFDEKEEVQTDYSEMMTNSKTAVFEAAMNSDSYLDVKELSLTHKQLSLAVSFSKEETYNVPTMIGKELTNVTLKLIHNEEEDPKVAVSFANEFLGEVSARFTLEGGKTKGYIACKFAESVTKLEKVADIMGEDVSVIQTKDMDRDFAFSRIDMRKNTEEVASEALYRIAKKFLQSIGEINED